MRKLSRLLYCLFSSRIQRPFVVVRSEAAGEEEEEHKGAQQEEVQQQPRGKGARVRCLQTFEFLPELTFSFSDNCQGVPLPVIYGRAHQPVLILFRSRRRCRNDSRCHNSRCRPFHGGGEGLAVAGEGAAQDTEGEAEGGEGEEQVSREGAKVRDTLFA